jgi:hypothetical protein
VDSNGPDQNARDRAGPGEPTTTAEFVEALRDLKAVSGLSLRELQRCSGLPRTTIAHALNPERSVLPPWDRGHRVQYRFGQTRLRGR